MTKRIWIRTRLHPEKGLNQNRVFTIIVAIAALMAFLLLVPIIPAEVTSYTGPSQATGNSSNQMLPWSGSDPSGTYLGYRFDNGTYMTSIATYERMLQDPYSTICPNSGVKMEGSNVLFTCNPTYSYAASQQGLESVAYLFIRHGGLYFNGSYHLR